MFRLRSSFGVATVLSMGLVLAGCQSMGIGGEDSATLTPAERQLRAEAGRSWGAAGIGCLLGAAAGVLVSRGDTGNRVLAGGIGCLAGGAVGYAAGEYINARNRQYASDQEGYRALTAAAEEDIQRYQRFNRTAEQLIAQQQQKISHLNAEYQAGRVSSEEYGREVASAGRNVELLRNQTQEIQGNIDTLQQDISKMQEAGYNTAELQQKRNALAAERDRLQQQVEILIRTYNDVPETVRPAIG